MRLVEHRRHFTGDSSEVLSKLVKILAGHVYLCTCPAAKSNHGSDHRWRLDKARMFHNSRWSHGTRSKSYSNIQSSVRIYGKSTEKDISRVHQCLGPSRFIARRLPNNHLPNSQNPDSWNPPDHFTRVGYIVVPCAARVRTILPPKDLDQGPAPWLSYLPSGLEEATKGDWGDRKG
ncbi:hypothetical protein EV356DRAFT_78649 [Viridothelium virens]|uniref:Uncharacterized protein n=1 Tax=Viridothelium virens TaxID=1048519 RepID=A0A6A6HFQ4_VIRVR|nr:hypothetical protein EV356DRAFT_78649 [Viridothelium virens]